MFTRYKRTLLASIALLASCGDIEAEGASTEEDGHGEVRQQTQAILSGTNTNDRTEVGLWQTGIGNCTATMITDRIAIAAGHCSFDYPVPIYGSTFQGKTVTKAYIFTSGGWTMPTSTGHRTPFNSDLTVLQLDSAVTGVSPASIATRYVNNGEAVTAMGFGCNAANPDSGGGTKRYRTYNYSSTTNVLCPGDSGGPLFLGNLTDYGRIVGINSTGAPNYGDPVTYREDIAAVIRSWDANGFETGVSRVGFDIATQTNVTAPNLCRQACLANSLCTAWTWALNNTCVLKRGLPRWESCPLCVSGLAGNGGTSETGYDRPGGDFWSGASANVDACRLTCAKDGRCKAFPSFNSTCFLKSHVPDAVALSGATSGVRKPITYTTNIWAGGEIGAAQSVGNFPTPENCASLCVNNTSCTGFTLTRPLVGQPAMCQLYGTGMQQKASNGPFYARGSVDNGNTTIRARNLFF